MMLHYLAVKRPRVGDTLLVHVGPATVTAVHDYGLRVDCTDGIGRTWDLERAAGGHWARYAPAPRIGMVLHASGLYGLDCARCVTDAPTAPRALFATVAQARASAAGHGAWHAAEDMRAALAHAGSVT